MTTAMPMLDTYPRDFSVDAGILARCIDECSTCAETCTMCADSDLGEEDVQMLVKCNRLNLDCADICTACGRVIGRQTEYDANVTRAIVEACAQACRSSGDECERHSIDHEHCRICADACRRCEQACRELLGAMM
jgi:Domain of Unknown Function (DUF326)